MCSQVLSRRLRAECRGAGHLETLQWRPTFGAPACAAAGEEPAADGEAVSISASITSAARLMQPEEALLTEKGILTVASEPLVGAARIRGGDSGAF